MTSVAKEPSELLQHFFGFDSFRPGQETVINHLLQGHSAAAVFPTGGGKSLCYQIPALALPGLTIVVSPLIALMKDQIDALSKRGIAATRLDSSLSAEEYQQVVSSLKDGSLSLLYVAPERFNNERFRQLIGTTDISLFAVDEAHCISEWGHNFRPDYLKLARFATECGADRILALTATAPPKVLDDICRQFGIREEHATRTDFYRDNLTLLATATTAEQRDELLVAQLNKRERGATIVYVTLQRTAETVAEMLRQYGFAARHYHASVKPDDRSETQDWFLNGDDNIIVATIAFGMGIDKSDIRYIYHYNVAKSIENYAQEIGRAGRDGEPATCETLLVPDDFRTLENFIYGDTPDETAVHALVADIFSHGPDFGLSVYQLSRKHDIRELVVRTLLTYVELEGYLKGGTPYYAEYKFKPLLSSAEILQRFDGDRRQFLSMLFKQSQRGRSWFTLDLEACVAATQSDRQRVIRALDYLADEGMIELKATGVHHRFRVTKSPNVAELAARLAERVIAREERELERLETLLGLMTHDGCQVSALGSYFGEPLPQPCGHCSWCISGKSLVMERTVDAVPPKERWDALMKAKSEHPEVLCSPSSLARFACGITSPQLSKAKLSSHPLFGCLADIPFATIREMAS